MTPGHDYFDVDGAVGVHAWGRTTSEAFAGAALGVLALSVSPDDVRDAERREVRAQGGSAEHQLVNWINECLYVHEIEGFAVHAVDVDVCGPTVVHGFLHGEEIDHARHRLAGGVKAARSAGAQVSRTTEGWDVRIVVDV